MTQTYIEGDISSEVRQFDEMRVLRRKQRELVLSGYDENQRATLMGFMPQNLAMQFLPGHWERPQGDEVGFISLNEFPEFFKTFETQPGETYTLLFELLTTAQTPIEARNIVNVIGALSYLAESQNTHLTGSQNVTHEISHSRSQFLKKTRRPEVSHRVSDVANFFVQDAVIKFLDGDDKMVTTRRMHDVYGFGDSSRVMTDHGEFALEAMLTFILDQQQSYYYRAKLLELFYKIDFNNQFNGYHKEKTKIFKWDATSFWLNVDGSWVGLPKQFTPEVPVSDGQGESDESESQEDVTTSAVQVPVEIIPSTLRRRIDYLENLLADFRTKEGQWGGHMNIARARITNLEGLVRAEETANDALSGVVLRLMGQIEGLQEELEKRGRTQKRVNIFVQDTDTSGDVFGQFLAGLQLSRAMIVEKPIEERKALVNRLRKLAGMAFHPSTNSANPDERVMQDLNAGLDALIKE